MQVVQGKPASWAQLGRMVRMGGIFPISNGKVGLLDNKRARYAGSGPLGAHWTHRHRLVAQRCAVSRGVRSNRDGGGARHVRAGREGDAPAWEAGPEVWRRPVNRRAAATTSAASFCHG